MNRIRYQRLEVKVLDCAPDTLAHEVCGTQCKRHQRRVRTLWERGTEIPVLLHVEVGVYKCPLCRYFWTSEPPCAGKKRRYTDQVRSLACASIEEDRMPIRRVGHRMNRDFGLFPVLSTVHAWWREGAEAIDIKEYQDKVVAHFSGVLCIDEIYDKQWAILVATDPLQNRPIAYQLGKTATSEDMKVFCEHLKGIGINPVLVMTDESEIYPEVLKRVWAMSRQALCRFHVTRHISDAAMKAMRQIYHQMPKPKKRQTGRPKKMGRPREDKAKREARKKVWQGRFLVVKRTEKISEEETEQFQEMLELAPGLSVPRAFMDDWYAMFKENPRPATLRKRRDEFVEQWGASEYESLKKQAQKLKDDDFFEKLIAPFYYQNGEATNNNVERENREYRKRQKGHYRMRSQTSIEALRERQLTRKPPLEQSEPLLKRFGCKAGKPTSLAMVGP